MDEAGWEESLLPSLVLSLDLPGSQCKGAALVVDVWTRVGRPGCKSQLLRYKEDTLVAFRTPVWGI